MPRCNPASAAVDDTDLAEPGPGGGGHVFLHDGRDVARREGVEIELGLERHAGHIRHVIRLVRTIRHAGIRP